MGAVTSMLAMFEQPWQRAIVLVVVLVLFSGSRITELMGWLVSGLRHFRDGIHFLAGHEPSDLQQPDRYDFARSPRLTGQNLRGVPLYEGRLTIPPSTHDGITLRNLMRSLGIAAAVGLLDIALGHIEGIAAVCALGLALALLCAVVCAHELYSAKRVRKLYGHLRSIEELASSAGTTDLVFLLNAKERGVQPCCIVDGEEYYDVRDLGESSVLLRPADAAEPESLLRPVSGGSLNEPNLLRPGGRDA